MGLLKNPQLLIIKFICWLVWISSFALAQFNMSEGITGFVNFPSSLHITCLGNLAVCVTSLIRGRLDLELAARDVLEILLSPKLENIDGIKPENGLTTCKEDGQTASTERVVLQRMGKFFKGLRDRLGINLPCLQTASTEGQGGIQDASAEGESPPQRDPTGENLPITSTKLRTASVVLLSNDSSNSSIREFMKSNAAIVDSILLRFLPLEDARTDASQRDPPEFTIATCTEGCSSCDCIIFWTVEEITGMLGRRMPRTLKVLSNSRCLLPCHTCLLKRCHGCDEASMLRVPSSRSVEQAEEGNGLTSDPEMVPKVLTSIHARSINTEEHICICIPVHDASSDVWTELLLRSLRSKDAESRGVRVKATEAMESYLAGRRGGAKEREESDYNIVSFIMPRLTEVVINVVLTFWFRIDGFSSSLVARRIVRDYMVDSKGSGFAANSFLTKAVVILNSNNTRICQVLAFRGNFLGIKRLSFMAGFVNLICSLGWVFLIGYEADISPSLSYQSFSTVIFSVAMALAMDIVIIITGNNKLKVAFSRRRWFSSLLDLLA